ncbi:MAG TPA: orotidine 5'-phosphate decarboxylase, partial [Bacteroidetes bacterium]|nr:orotidine 5'-phosphate decarboxylase [Bacteroidota bacterium]
MDFNSKLRNVTDGKIGLCIGLDPVLDRLPETIRTSREPLYAFNSEIIERTHDIAAAYKPNLAFYEALGDEGWRQLEKTVQAVPDKCLVIADGKRGDIGSTA